MTAMGELARGAEGAAVRFITRKWPPAVGGMETYSVRLVEELAKRGPIEVVALAGRASGREPTALSLIKFGIRTAIRLMRSPEARVVHIADVASWPLGWIALLRHPRSRIVLSAHGSDLSYAWRRGWLSALYRFYLRAGAAALRRARVIANSEYIAGLARRAGFERVGIVPLATDLQCEIGGERRDLLYAGRIMRSKGLRFLVEQILPLLPAEVRLRVAGTLWEESERELLSDDRIDYLGRLSQAELAAEYAHAAAVLIPTRESEGFGLVAIEAAACGAYVIASAHSGLVDVVKEPIGQTVCANDASAWASAIRSVLAWSDDERESRAVAARETVDRCYRWRRVAEETLAIYEGS
jgi:glycosyltransferase involved in cell wall biosynthesis